MTRFCSAFTTIYGPRDSVPLIVDPFCPPGTAYLMEVDGKPKIFCHKIADGEAMVKLMNEEKAEVPA